MKTTKKALLFTFCAVLLVVASVLGTMAYLTSSDTVTNTFTVGNVNIILDEAVVNTETGKKALTETGEEERTSEPQTFKIVPGRVVDKDPTVTVLKDSEQSYVRMLLTVTYNNEAEDVLAKSNYSKWFNFDTANWAEGKIIKTEKSDTTTTRTYEFRYKNTVAKATEDTSLPKLFTQITVPGELTNKQIKTLVNLKIVAEAHAIQAEGFTTADAAWEAFDNQVEVSQ